MIRTVYSDLYLTNTANMFQTKGSLYLKYHLNVIPVELYVLCKSMCSVRLTVPPYSVNVPTHIM